jgi:hypothetical protein
MTYVTHAMAHPIAKSLEVLDGRWREVAERVPPLEGAAPEWHWHLLRPEVEAIRALALTGEVALVHGRRQPDGVSIILASLVPAWARPHFRTDRPSEDKMG